MLFHSSIVCYLNNDEDSLIYRIYTITAYKEGVCLKHRRRTLSKYVAHNILQMMGVSLVEYTPNTIPITKKVFLQQTIKKDKDSHLFIRTFLFEFLVSVDKIQRNMEMVYDDYNYTKLNDDSICSTSLKCDSFE